MSAAACFLYGMQLPTCINTAFYRNRDHRITTLEGNPLEASIRLMGRSNAVSNDQVVVASNALVVGHAY